MGGRAFPDVIPVPRQIAIDLVEYYATKLQTFHYAALGSTGKKDFSGDVDIAIDERDFTYRQLVQKLGFIVGFDNINLSGKNFKQVYTRFKTPQGAYQVDLMLGNPQLLEFTHYAPEQGTSDYTGSHRTELIKAVAKTKNSAEVYVGSTMVARIGATLHHDIGLLTGARWCPPRKDGKGYTKKMVAVEQSEQIALFNQTFPGLHYDGNRVNIYPSQITAHLFNCGPDEVNSYEGVCRAINGNDSLKRKSDLIWKLYTERLDEIKLPHPTRLI